jgi:hypothetical protein
MVQRESTQRYCSSSFWQREIASLIVSGREPIMSNSALDCLSSGRFDLLISRRKWDHARREMRLKISQGCLHAIRNIHFVIFLHCKRVSLPFRWFQVIAFWGRQGKEIQVRSRSFFFFAVKCFSPRCDEPTLEVFNLV